MLFWWGSQKVLMGRTLNIKGKKKKKNNSNNKGKEIRKYDEGIIYLYRF